MLHSLASLIIALGLSLLAANAALAECVEYAVPDSFVMKQSNAFDVQMSNVRRGPWRASHGEFSADAFTAGIGRGSVTGLIALGRRTNGPFPAGAPDEAGTIWMDINWQTGSAGRYRGYFKRNGQVYESATWEGMGPSNSPSFTMPKLRCLKRIIQPRDVGPMLERR